MIKKGCKAIKFFFTSIKNLTRHLLPGHHKFYAERTVYYSCSIFEPPSINLHKL